MNTEKNIERANSIKIGDLVVVQGNKGLVEDINRFKSSNGKPTTYIKVDFTGLSYLENYGQYNHGWYGCYDEYFNY